MIIIYLIYKTPFYLELFYDLIFFFVRIDSFPARHLQDFLTCWKEELRQLMFSILYVLFV